MNELQYDPLDHVTLTREGKVILSEKIMSEVVLETLGCALRYNERDAGLGLRLLRGADEPPVRIERETTESDGIVGVVDAKAFLDKVGFPLPSESTSCPCKFYQQYRMIEIVLDVNKAGRRPEAQSVLDDFPAL